MSPEQFALVMGALAGLISAVCAGVVAILRLHTSVNGVLHELVASTERAAYARGQLQGAGVVGDFPTEKSAVHPTDK
jgi:hypothetical protein